MSEACPYKVTSYEKRNRRKTLQQFLNYLKHAKDCHRATLKDPILDSYEIKYCKSVLCVQVDIVVTHKTLMNCKSSKSCNVIGCYSSLKTFSHCKECNAPDCFVCFLVKGKKNKCIKQADEEAAEKTSKDLLDTKCGVYFEEKSIATDTCEETRTVETQTDEVISDDLPLEVDCKNKKTIVAHLPGGLILEDTEIESMEENKKDSQSSICYALREKQLNGFIRTVIGKTDVITTLDKKLIYFYMYIASIEREIYESTNSKEEYLKTLLAKIQETNERFKEYKGKQKQLLLIKDAAQFFFRNKIIEMFGSNVVKEIKFPGSVVLKLGEPKTASEKETKRWQKSLTLSDRDNAILKMSSKHNSGNIPFFRGEMVDILRLQCGVEELMYKECSSKACYYQFVSDSVKIKPKPENDEEKKYLKNYKKMVKRFPENKINEISNDKTEEKSKKDDVEVGGSSVPSVFCYSHNLLLTYSVTYQLWKKLQKDKTSAKSKN